MYVCTHGYRRVSRSSGSRPRQKVRYTSCKARFTASVVCEVVNSVEVLFIKITAQHLEHDDHPVSLDQWRHYSQNRASIVEHPYLIHEAELMRRIGSNKRTARAHIETLSGKVCTMKDMHNLYARLKKREDGIKTNAALVDENPAVRVESVLQQFVDAHVENHVSILSADDGSNEAMCLSSKAMKEHFAVFPELCLLDVTISPQNSDDYQMQGFLSMDALGNAKPVFLALSSNTSKSLFRRICRDFKRTHPKWKAIKILVMDKLHPDVVDVLHHEFPDAQVLLCQFHAIKFLAALVAQPEFDIPSLALQEQVRELMKQMVFTHAHQTYNESKALLLQHLGNRADHPLLVHINQHWEPYRNLWASYWRGIVLEFSAFFNKGMECFWNPLKNAFERTGGGLNRNATGSSGISAVADAAATAAAAAASATSGGDNSDSSSNSSRVGVGAGGARAVVGVDAGVGVGAGLDLSAGVGHASITVSVGLGAAVKAPHMESTGSAGVQKASITKCISEVLTMIKFIEEEWTSKMMILEMTKPLTEFSSDPLLHYMVNCLSSFAVGLISSQIMALNTSSGDISDGTITVTPGQSESSASASAVTSSLRETAMATGLSMSASSAAMASMTMSDSTTGIAAAPAVVSSNPVHHSPVHHSHNIMEIMNSVPGDGVEPPIGSMSMSMPMAPTTTVRPGMAVTLVATSEPETMIWTDQNTHKTHVMRRDCSACDCEFYELYQLPCQHLIWYELSVLKNKQVSMSAVGARWFLRTFQYPKIVSHRESNEVR